ncbi:MAG: hypothetical protein B6D36_08880 [Planctomycetes bacterium UTPLA1]|nr:MAG: hypothetical protein B6D36_08880 [Planctomycetes bacterium UTPLA1]
MISRQGSKCRETGHHESGDGDERERRSLALETRGGERECEGDREVLQSPGFTPFDQMQDGRGKKGR